MFSMNDTVAKEILRDLLTMYICFNTQKKVKFGLFTRVVSGKIA